MARILAYTTPARGHLFPLVPILDELGRRGHHIALRTLASEVPSMQARGFDAAPISDHVGAITHDDWRAGNPRAALARAVRIFTQRAEHDGPDLARAIDQERPDALLVDVTPGGPSPPPRPGAAPGRRSAPTRCRCAQRTRRRSGPGCPRPTVRWDGSATGSCARSCSARWSAR
jgi:hypothetical protein